MKKFLIILLVLLMIPVYSFSTGSPTINKKLITCDPTLEFEMADTLDEWPAIIERLKDVKEDTDGYILLDAVYVYIDKPYERVVWTFGIPIITEHEPFILIIDSEAIVKQEVSITEEGQIVTDFSECEPNMYYVCFYIKALD